MPNNFDGQLQKVKNPSQVLQCQSPCLLGDPSSNALFWAVDLENACVWC